MRLSELSPKFLKIEAPDSWRCEGVEKGQADGISFLCPKCFKEKGGPVGCHSIICWCPGVEPTMEPGPGRWLLFGTSFDDLSLVASSSSVQLNGGCKAHFFVTAGEIKDA